jgi:DNA-binding response OmpR family regulator
MIKILLLEDDQLLSETLQLFLEREGYVVDVALNRTQAEDLTYSNRYDLYLFDINLPEGSGLELLEYLRNAEDRTSTIFITALSDMDSIAKGFDLGATDYIKKPFNPQELLIRLRAKFRTPVIKLNNIEFDPDADVIRKDGKVVDIGNVQHKIFRKLILNCGYVVEKVDLYEALEYPSDNALRVALTKIKQRLSIEIKNIRGKGYLIEKV